MLAQHSKGPAFILSSEKIKENEAKLILCIFKVFPRQSGKCVTE
jgi:hypothetical protein